MNVVAMLDEQMMKWWLDP